MRPVWRVYFDIDYEGKTPPMVFLIPDFNMYFIDGKGVRYDDMDLAFELVAEASI